MKRFEKEVIKYGNSKVIRVAELEVGDTVIVMTKEEFKHLIGDTK